MKKIFLLFLITFIAKLGCAQLLIGYHYHIRDKDSINYETTDGRVIIKHIRPGQYLKAKLESDKNGKVKIKFWGFRQQPDKVDDNYVNYNDRVDCFYFQVEQRRTLTVSKFISIPYSTWEVGVTTIPFKIRFGYTKNDVAIPNDVSTSINGGVYLGMKWGRTSFYDDNTQSNTFSVTPAVFLGPTLVPITSDNTLPKAIIKSNELGISTGLGIQIAKSDLNLGFFIGKDFTTSNAAKSWYYDRKTWVGFGIGYKLSILNGGK